MKLFVGVALVALITSSLAAAPTVTFSSADGGNWLYSPTSPGAGVFTFVDPVGIDESFVANPDPVTTLTVNLPDLNISGSGGTYTYTPAGSALVEFVGGGSVHLRGTLLPGGGTATGTSGDAYPGFGVDVVNITSPSGNSVVSPAIADFLAAGRADFDLGFTGAVGQGYTSFTEMVDEGYVGRDGFSGSMTANMPATTVPTPGALLLGALGTGLVGWLRRREAA